MVLLDRIFGDNFFVKITFGIQIVLEFIQRMQMIDILLKYILWYEFLNDLDAKSDFDKNFITKNPVK